MHLLEGSRFNSPLMGFVYRTCTTRTAMVVCVCVCVWLCDWCCPNPNRAMAM